MMNIGDELLLDTFCHENGHMLCDFPDLYDYGFDDIDSYGVGQYCLMGWAGPEENNPIQICAYFKNQAGWTANLRTIRPGMHATITSASNDFYIHKLSTTEYFILENRQKAGRDKGLPDAGLAIWHVDELGDNEHQQMTKDLHYECSLEQADNKFDLERHVNLGDDQDLFGAPSSTTFGARTHPDSKWWNGRSSGLELTQISTPGPTMTFRTR